MIKPISRGEHERRTAGVKGGSNKMFGKQSASLDKPGNTGKDQRADRSKHAVGGVKTTGHSISKPASPGRTAPPTKGRAR
jgi:hypothetical protein